MNAVREQQRQGRGEHHVIPVAGHRLGDPLPFGLADHQPLAAGEHPAARVDHDDPHPAEAPPVAPLDAVGPLVGPDGEVGEQGRRVAGLLHLAPQLVLGQVLRREITEMLVDPVAHVGGGDPGRPPRLGIVVAAPGRRDVPVVVHVVIVEDHRGRDDRQQPAHRGLAPGLTVEEAVLGEVRDLVAGRVGWVAALLDELPRGRPRIVGVDLVADQEHQIRPAVARRVAQVLGAGDQRVRPVLLLLVFPRAPGAPAAPHDGQLGDPAGAEGQPERPLRVRRPQHARRELRSGSGQRTVPSSTTWYSCALPGWRPSTTTSA